MIIYKITNIKDDKCYIGQTIIKPNKRISQHINSSKRGSIYYLHSAIRKYGWNNFEWEVLCECKSKEELDEMEFHYIKQYNSKSPNGYNITDGGEGTVGYKHSKETRKKISESHTGIKKGPSKKLKEYSLNRPNKHNRKISESLVGHKRSKESIKKQSNSVRGKNNHFFDKHHTKKSKNKIRKKSFKFWKILYGKEVIIPDFLKDWCIENNVNYNSLKYSFYKKKEYKGYKLEKNK